MHIVGLDIGYSERKRTNAMAIVRNGALRVMDPMFPSERDATLRSLDAVDVIAIDAPIVPRSTPEDFVRKCEHIFICGPFQRRCKPGMSHVGGTGRRLRAEGRSAADVAERAARNVVEAFPNAFLGVVLPEEAFANPPKLRRGRKFDWLYNQWRCRDLFRRVVAAAQLPAEIARLARTRETTSVARRWCACSPPPSPRRSAASSSVSRPMASFSRQRSSGSLGHSPPSPVHLSETSPG